ncbi:MAG: FtsX-like permease family protein [Conexibacter sp.]|nr:FtsX-like permease family protein [Conexibacter sp.]
MIGLETLRIAVGGILANKLRSGLTILGLMIGVASVIVLIAVGNGSSKSVSTAIESLGSNVLLVISGTSPNSTSAAPPETKPLTIADAHALEHNVLGPDIKGAAPTVSATATIVNGNTSYQPSSLVGTTTAYQSAQDYKLADGSFFTAAEVTRRERVIVLGSTVVQNLGASVGQTVQVGGVNFQVVGILASRGSNGTTNQDDVALAPITAVQDTLSGYGDVNSITVQATSRAKLDDASAEVTAILNQRHKLANGGASDFQVINQGSLLAASASTSSVFTTLLAEVAAISLLVGGIGVMNIMLVSVTERTREIGIRKAIGARRSDVLAQFLFEAVLVSMLGGVFGVVLGIVGSQFKIAGVQPLIATYSIFLAFGAALATGLFFGTYPASRAARLRPIEALRFE